MQFGCYVCTIIPDQLFFAAYSTSLFFTFCGRTKDADCSMQVLPDYWKFYENFRIFLLIPSVIEYVNQCKNQLAGFSVNWPYPNGLITYMIYLYTQVGDAFSFINVLPAFGPQRSAGHIVLLPQVFWRYVKIFFTASPTTIEYSVAMFEIVTFIFFLYLLMRAFKTNLNVSYILYSGIVLVVPTLTGTLTSIPRYVLDAFPLHCNGSSA
jgi:hypothetical protein